MNTPTVTFAGLQKASDAELASAISKILIGGIIPIGTDEQMALEEIVNQFEDSAEAMPADHRKRLIEALQRMIAPLAN